MYSMFVSCLILCVGDRSFLTRQAIKETVLCPAGRSWRRENLDANRQEKEILIYVVYLLPSCPKNFFLVCAPVTQKSHKADATQGSTEKVGTTLSNTTPSRSNHTSYLRPLCFQQDMHSRYQREFRHRHWLCVSGMTPDWKLSLKALFSLAVVTLADRECPEGTTYSPRRHICLNAIPVPLDYRNAQLSCGFFDGRLAKVESEEEHDVLSEHLKEKGVPGTFWLGGTNINSTWFWYDGKNLTFHNWKDNEPANPEKENCLLHEAESGLWSSADCEGVAHYVCEMEPLVRRDEGCPEEPTCPPCPACVTTTPESCPEITECPVCPTDEPTTTSKIPTTTTVPLPEPTCPFRSNLSPIPTKTPTWKRSGLTRYAYFSEAKNFFEAEASCAYLGAQLVSIHSKKESAFVASLIPASDKTSQQLWIGGLSPGKDRFCWTDRGSWNYDELRTANYQPRCVLFHYPDPKNRDKHE
uniref:C-type lectin domain-containing protein n=1 Tax=Steinernema glaseri TaxID=37863 RepID=A0A1I7ZMN8_9BILA